MMRRERVVVADRVDGTSLDPAQGPFELIVEGDLRPARAVHSVSAIRLNPCDEQEEEENLFGEI